MLRLHSVLLKEKGVSQVKIPYKEKGSEFDLRPLLESLKEI